MSRPPFERPPEPETPEIARALERCAELIRNGSRSFALASGLFSRRIRAGAFGLYGWCRWCDDEIDTHAGEGPAKLGYRVERLRELTLGAITRAPGAAPARAELVAFGHVVRAYGIPSEYALELIEGMAMDGRSERYETLEALELYAFRVAGTVGLMMTHVMGVSREAALRNACDLGIAMQLTNIARDVMEDAALGRVYLPLAWLRSEGVPPDEVADPAHREAVARVVARLLDRAELRYRSGWEGIDSLPGSAAFAIGAAADIYRAIGVRVRARGAHAWDTRTVVSLGRKLALAALALFKVAARLRGRGLRSRPCARLNQVWRFP